jgi:hypothetical protein
MGALEDVPAQVLHDLPRFFSEHPAGLCVHGLDHDTAIDRDHRQGQAVEVPLERHALLKGEIVKAAATDTVGRFGIRERAAIDGPQFP